MIAGVASIGGGGREFKSPVAGVALFGGQKSGGKVKFAMTLLLCTGKMIPGEVAFRKAVLSKTEVATGVDDSLEVVGRTTVGGGSEAAKACRGRASNELETAAADSLGGVSC